MNKLLILTWTKSFVPWRILPWLTRACSGSPAEKGAQGRLYQPSDISNSSGPIRHTTNTIALNMGLLGDRPDIHFFFILCLVPYPAYRISMSVICPDIRYLTGYQIQYPAFATYLVSCLTSRLDMRYLAYSSILWLNPKLDLLNILENFSE